MDTADGVGRALDGLARRELVLVTGKGGVGKTSVSAVLGAALRRRGRRVLLLEIDPRENLHQMLGVPPSGGEPVEAGRGLWLQNLPPRGVMDAIVREQVRIDAFVRRILASPVYHHFVEGAPGLEEVAVLGHAWRVVRGRAGRGSPRVDTVVLDAPATGHGVSLLAAPGVVARMIRQGPFARMADELEQLVGDSERSAVVAVTTAEEMPVQETLELVASLDERLGRRPDLVVANQIYPAVPDAEGDAVEELWRQRRAENERELARLAAASPGPVALLPLLPMERGPELVEAMRSRLEGV